MSTATLLDEQNFPFCVIKSGPEAHSIVGDEYMTA